MIETKASNSNNYAIPLANKKMIGVWAAIPENQRTPAQNTALAEHYFTSVDAPALEMLREKDKLMAEQAVLRGRGSFSLVFEEKKEEPFAHILVR